jgi:signal transduction histidine kinase
MLIRIFPIALALIFAFLPGCSRHAGKAQPAAVDGVLDLRDWDFEKDGPVRLKGTLELYWDTLLEPGDFSSGVPEKIRRYVPFPATWHTLSLPSPKKPHFYNGTYRLTLKVSRNSSVPALRAISQASAVKLWINGRLLFKEGTIGSNWRENDPRPFHVCGIFNADSSEIKILCQVACFNHFCLALPDIDISSSKEMLHASSSENAWNSATALLLLIIATYSLVLFLKRKKDLGNLYMFFVCFFCSGICLTCFYGDIFQYMLSSSPSLHIVFADLLIMSSILFLKASFPLDIRPGHIRFVFSVSALSIILWAGETFKIAPTGFYSMLVYSMWLGLVAVLLLCFGITIIAKRRECHGSFLIGMFFMISISSYSACCYLFSNHSTAGDYRVYEICFLGFAICQLYILAIRDAQTQNQLAQKFEEIIHTEKLATLGTVVAGVAHEINNPNNSLLLDIQANERAWQAVTPILDEHVRTGGDFDIGGYRYSEFKEELSGMPERMKRNSERIKHITEDLRSFAKKDALFTEDVDVNGVVRSALSVIEHITKRSTRNLSVNLPSDAPRVKGNARYLEQVIINLVKNACQSLPSPDRGVSIGVSLDPKSKAVTLTIRDQGVGMDEAATKKIFTPFYTTKGIEGTGLGLSICNNIIKNHGGRIEVESKIGSGTAVSVILPLQGAA